MCGSAMGSRRRSTTHMTAGGSTAEALSRSDPDPIVQRHTAWIEVTPSTDSMIRHDAGPAGE